VLHVFNQRNLKEETERDIETIKNIVVKKITFEDAKARENLNIFQTMQTGYT